MKRSRIMEEYGAEGQAVRAFGTTAVRLIINVQ